MQIERLGNRAECALHPYSFGCTIPVRKKKKGEDWRLFVYVCVSACSDDADRRTN